MKKLFYSLTLLSLLATSCKKEEENTYNPNVKGTLSLEFDNIVGSEDLQLETGSYTNTSGESYNITTLKYFISNIALTKADGSVYTVPQDESYFLIDESDVEKHEVEIQVPEGEYTGVSYLIGVDSLRNTMDVSKRTGALDPSGEAAGMYWSWNSGYIFFKIEGTSSASTIVGNTFEYHIGLFGGLNTPTINNLKKVSLDLKPRGTAKVTLAKPSNIHMTVDISKIFDGNTKVSIAKNPAVHANPFSATIANNYASMILHDHTEN